MLQYKARSPAFWVNHWQNGTVVGFSPTANCYGHPKKEPVQKRTVVCVGKVPCEKAGPFVGHVVLVVPGVWDFEDS